MATSPNGLGARRAWGALAGLVAGGLSLAVGLLVAGIIDVVSPIDAVGGEFIDHTPPWLKDLAIEWFGTNDKRALRIGIFTVIGLLALAAGALAVTRRWVATAAIGGFGVLGAWVAVQRPGAEWSAALPPLLGAVVGVVVLRRLLSRLDPVVEMPTRSRVPLEWDRRRFLVGTGGAAAAAVVAGAWAGSIDRRRVREVEAAIPDMLPPVAERVAIPAGADVVPGTPYVTPNGDFYRIDTALSFPRANINSWAMTIEGMVDQPLRLTYADLVARPQVERAVTLACVSNAVGGDLIGNAEWQGVLLADLLEEAGMGGGVEQVFCTSIDGWTCGFPIEAALDGRDAMVVLGMNGEALPLAHGFPARLVVPGLYGYVSAVKWLDSLRLTTWNDETGYWVPRGWSRLGPIKTQSRIDVLRQDGAAVLVAGVAWAQHTGVDRVEVRVDDGEWRATTLAPTVSADTWRQWSTRLDLAPGEHRVTVRATDAGGYTQTEERADPAPDGATGHHSRKIDVDAV